MLASKIHRDFINLTTRTFKKLSHLRFSSSVDNKFNNLANKQKRKKLRELLQITKKKKMKHNSTLIHKDIKEKNIKDTSEPKTNIHCNECNKPLVKVMRCSRCKMAHYCGVDCQLKAWKEHKIECKKYQTNIENGMYPKPLYSYSLLF